jgi:NDP-sugar pyrophosphorylase family protein
MSPERSYLVTRIPEPGIKGDRIVQTNGKVDAISQDENVSLLGTGLQVINPGALDPTKKFESFHDVWNDLIIKQSLYVSKSQPLKWRAIDTPSDLEKAREVW